MKKFEIGKTYICTSICDHNCKWDFTVTARTEQTITVEIETYQSKKTKTFRICKGLSEMTGAESIYPLGRYSMAPVIHA